MADFKCFNSTSKRVIDIRGVKTETLLGNELICCIKSQNQNAIVVVAEQRGSVVLIDDRKFRIEPQQ